MTLYFHSMASGPRLMKFLDSFGRAINLITNRSKTYGLLYGPGDPRLVPALATVTWLKDGDPRTSLGTPWASGSTLFTRMHRWMTVLCVPSNMFAD